MHLDSFALQNDALMEHGYKVISARLQSFYEPC